MTEWGLIQVGGAIQPQLQASNSIRRMIKDADIPDYVKFAERENPLEPVVRKLEEKGFNAERAFKAFDEDCDEVLTINEIKEGLRFHKVGLLDTEMKMLVDAMDKNHDGVLTMEEW